MFWLDCDGERRSTNRKWSQVCVHMPLTDIKSAILVNNAATSPCGRCVYSQMDEELGIICECEDPFEDTPCRNPNKEEEKSYIEITTEEDLYRLCCRYTYGRSLNEELLEAIFEASERTPAYRGGSFLLPREQHH